MKTTRQKRPDRVICKWGDCLDILPSIKEKFIIVTDPPFNIGYHYNEYKDKLSQENYYEMLGKVFSYSPFVVIHFI